MDPGWGQGFEQQRIILFWFEIIFENKNLKLFISFENQ